VTSRAAMLLVVLAVAMIVYVLMAAPRCDANSPPGPTIGGVIKIGGC
jgi:hypothetical protein